jgi:antitoxin VapB
MPLNIRDPEVNRLAAQVAELKGTTKTQAVREALKHELARVRKKLPLWERIKPLREGLARHPDTGVVIDKAFFDELSGE